MPTTETHTTLPVARIIEDSLETQGYYEGVRFNAMKHKIQSRHTVLSHEDDDVYRELVTALMTELQPIEPTEAHLVEELAGIMWRQRRVLLAEGAAINRGLHFAAYHRSDLVKAAAPLDFDLAESDSIQRHFLSKTPDEVTARQRETKDDLQGALRAKDILESGGSDVYEAALDQREHGV